MASDRCRATVLRPEITDHYRSDNASEPRLVGAVRPASLPESAKTSLAQKLTAQARTALALGWYGQPNPLDRIGRDARTLFLPGSQEHKSEACQDAG